MLAWFTGWQLCSRLRFKNQQYFIDTETGGFLSAVKPAQDFLQKPVKNKDDNVRATRFFNQLWFYTGNKHFRTIAESGMGYLTSERVLDAYYFLPGVLQAEYELTHESVHVTIVGNKDDPRAEELRNGPQKSDSSLSVFCV